jgi:hydroxyquinol 1,2-dioxygenase
MSSLREFDEFSITESVVDTFAKCPDARLKEILVTTTRRLHDLVRELELTTPEWEFLIGYLTRTGQICDDRRQEFILLSDTFGVSTLVDAINNRVPAGATMSTVLGPFFVAGAEQVPNGTDIDTSEGGGEPTYVDVRIVDMAGAPVADAVVDVWHSDEEGFYDVQYGGDAALTRRGQFRSDQDGRVYFWSSLPSKYPIPNDGPVGQMLEAVGRHPFRPAHLHFKIAAAGYKELTTHIFVAESEYLDSDAVFGVKETLIDEFPRHPAGIAPDGRVMETQYRTLNWDFRLPKLSELPVKKAA